MRKSAEHAASTGGLAAVGSGTEADVEKFVDAEEKRQQAATTRFGHADGCGAADCGGLLAEVGCQVRVVRGADWAREGRIARALCKIATPVSRSTIRQGPRLAPIPNSTAGVA